MTKVVSIHSFRGGTGKSNITANLATTIAQTAPGHRVGIIDSDIQSPGIHAIFQLSERRVTKTLNDYLWGYCSIAEATYDVTPSAVENASGRIFLTPSSMDASDISRVLHEAYDVRQLKDGFKDVIRALELDYLFIDTHPGLNEETLLSIAISHALVIVLRPDTQDYQGTSVTLEVARKLGVPGLFLALNKVLVEFDNAQEIEQLFAGYRRQLHRTYHASVGTVLPLSTDLVRLASSGLFVLQEPDHLFSQGIRELATKLTASHG
jgi:MinD-like ATPase involved in chromosome partitioning or flagellar assembly